MPVGRLLDTPAARQHTRSRLRRGRHPCPVRPAHVRAALESVHEGEQLRHDAPLHLALRLFALGRDGVYLEGSRGVFGVGVVKGLGPGCSRCVGARPPQHARNTRCRRSGAVTLLLLPKLVSHVVITAAQAAPHR
jgi:hypothetical protein